MKIAMIAAVLLFGVGCFQMDEPICYLDAHCDVSHSEIERQPDVKAIVWNQVYGRMDAPPPVTWVSRGDCHDGPGFSVYSGGCAIGIYRPGEGEVWVTVHADKWESYAHEFLHAHLDREGRRDNDHVEPEWQTLLPAALTALTAAGLR
jgi:hypothetical protein